METVNALIRKGQTN